MNLNKEEFNEQHTLMELKHYLPGQAPLKDFIHHNTLHAFQHMKFHNALEQATNVFGYKVYMSLDEYRSYHRKGLISEAVLRKLIAEKMGNRNAEDWLKNLTEKKYDTSISSRLFALRSNWKKYYKINIDKETEPVLFRVVGCYLDQGISLWHFPVSENGFLDSIREVERKSFSSFFSTPRARKFLLEGKCSIAQLLEILVGDEKLFEHYLIDQQFTHPGWSGMVAVLEEKPESLLDSRKISLKDFIIFELLLEIDALDKRFGETWAPVATRLEQYPQDVFSEIHHSELSDVYAIWQDALEWTYYDQVLKGIQTDYTEAELEEKKSFQAFFCIDDRECSLRRYIEEADPWCKTYGTPGFFNVEFYFQPEHGKFHTKLCPAPVNPGFLIKETETIKQRETNLNITKPKYGLIGGWLISQTLGFWAGVKLFVNILWPSDSPTAVSSSRHMDKQAKLSILNQSKDDKVNELQIGFTHSEMADRVEGLLRSTGLVDNFASIVYIVGHGASSVNNTHYAGYDCGACSGRPGSVNARVFAFMANNDLVRKMLEERGICIPLSTQFIGALHDTTRDEISFFDEEILSDLNILLHLKNMKAFKSALSKNAKERARRFVLMNNKKSPDKVHEEVKLRSVSLFEPRPELNHATNALCIIGRRELTRHLFLDRRAFMNSYDYRIDPDGKFLFNILKAAAPVCGGINLEYYFSRVDNYRLGAGTKLPHNIMGLIGVANGMDGDLRTGLPSQMIEVHDPVRLLIIVEQFPDVVLKTLKISDATYEWFINEWVHLVVVEPETRKLFRFENGIFVPYNTITSEPDDAENLLEILESTEENLPVYLIK